MCRSTHSRPSRGPLISSAIRDVSERRELEALAAHMAAVVESSADAIVSLSRDGTVLSWNPDAERLYGYSADEIRGRPVSLIVPDDRQRENP